MLFVLGLFLIAIGVVLALHTTIETYYQNYYGIRVPEQRIVNPYWQLGGLLVFFGIVVLVMAFFGNQSKKSDTTITMEIPKT
jgi:uncharacterized membrane protein YidH (DUF202 family)